MTDCLICGRSYSHDGDDDVHWLHEPDCQCVDEDISTGDEYCDCDVVACANHCPYCRWHDTKGAIDKEFSLFLSRVLAEGREFAKEILAPWLLRYKYSYEFIEVNRTWVVRDSDGSAVPVQSLPEWLTSILDIEVVPGFDPPLVFGVFVGDINLGIDNTGDQ